jgi:hypothetical protein
MPWGTTYALALQSANAAIAGIRAAGATVSPSVVSLSALTILLTNPRLTQQLVTISGNDYSGVRTWGSGNSKWMGPSNITDPLNNWIYEMHQYFDSNFGGSGVCDPTHDINNIFDAPTAWARANGGYVRSCKLSSLT